MSQEIEPEMEAVPDLGRESTNGEWYAHVLKLLGGSVFQTSGVCRKMNFRGGKENTKPRNAGKI
ncbi:MAG TPA: hypothetical protein VFA52_01250 [Candidatus Paceibacterota bacterium]|nr:hypothetical protein [Candidatus Paceibacterota bacterium]